MRRNRHILSSASHREVQGSSHCIPLILALFPWQQGDAHKVVVLRVRGLGVGTVLSAAAHASQSPSSGGGGVVPSMRDITGRTRHRSCVVEAPRLKFEGCGVMLEVPRLLVVEPGRVHESCSSPAAATISFAAAAAVEGSPRTPGQTDTVETPRQERVADRTMGNKF